MTYRLAGFVVGASLGVMSASSPSFAHHPGGAGNSGSSGPIVTIGAETLARGQSSVAFLFEYTALNSLSDAVLIDAAAQHRHVHSMRSIASPSIALAYGLTDDLTVSARLPYVSRSEIREGHHSHVHGIGAVNEVVARGNASGLGDASAMMQYRFVNDRATNTQWAVLAGLKAPTGRTGLRDRNGEAFEAEFSPGSGSWDWSAGLAVSQAYGRFAFHANAMQTWVGRSTWDEIEPTRLGDRFQYNLAATYRLSGAAGTTVETPRAHRHRTNGPAHVHREPGPTAREPAVDIVLELNGELHQHQKSLGVTDPNSGGHTAYLAPGVRVSLQSWTAFASLGVPVINDQNGQQAEPSVRLTTGLSMSF